MENYEIIWKQILSELENSISQIAFSTFIQPLEPVDFIGGKIILRTNNQIISTNVEKRREQIMDSIKKVNGEIYDFDVVVADSKEDYEKNYAEEEHSTVQPTSAFINPKFTFESFVVGPSNEFLYSAAKAVATHPDDSYNPLFIYGGSGLGKTHILMAIANYIKVHKPQMNVLYATCEQFTNEMIDSLSRGKGGGNNDFRRRYRKVDMLLIDDIQFLAKKQQTQQEFFNTFNELFMQGKQIIIASDRPPKEIEILEERLRTRFEGGLLADIQPPDIELRTAILKRKAEEQKCPIDIKVLSYLAELDDGDIRTLIGKLTKVIFASKLHERPITIDLVKDALKESTSATKEEIQSDDIVTCVCNFYKVPKADILSKKKNKEFTEPRQICIYLLTDMMNLPLMTIGEIMGGRDHATVIYSRNKISNELKTNTKLATEINDIRKMLLKQ